MIPSPVRPRRWGRTFVAALLVFLLLVMFGLSRLGAFLVREDPLQPADAIVVLSGTMYERQMEAVDLFRAGVAPRVYVFREVADWGERELIERGIRYLRAVDVQIDAMVRLGVPRDAIAILDQADSTANEAEHVHDLVTSQRYSRVIIVTSKQHTRRARLVMNRHMKGTGTTVIVRATRHDQTDAERWWRHRATIRFTLFESQRLLAYWIGAAD